MHHSDMIDPYLLFFWTFFSPLGVSHFTRCLKPSTLAVSPTRLRTISDQHSPLQRQGSGTVCHRKWRHQQHSHHLNPKWKHICSRYHILASDKQDSWAIAKKTRDAGNIWVHWKVLRVLTTHPTTFPEICNGFVPIDTKNVRTKFEVCSCTRSWDNTGYSKKLDSPCIRPRSIFSQIFNWLLFGWTLWIYLPNLTFVALPIPEIIGGTSKICGVPGFAHAPYSPKF